MGRERGWGTWLGGGGATGPREKPVGSDRMGLRLGVARERETNHLLGFCCDCS